MNSIMLCLALISALSVASCGSSDNNPPLDEPGTNADQQTIDQLSQAFDSLFLDELEELEAVVFNIRDRIITGEFELIEGTPDTANRTYACPLGGTVERYIQIITLREFEFFDAIECRGENYVLSGTELEFRVGSRRTRPFGRSRIFTARNVDLQSLQNNNEFVAELAFRSVPSEEIFANSSSTKILNGQFYVGGTLLKSVSEVNIRNEYPDDFSDSIMPIVTTISYRNSDTMSSLLSIETTNELHSSANTDQTIIEQGSMLVTYIEGEYKIEALPNSQTEFTYASPSGDMGTVLWSAVGFVPIINVAEPIGSPISVEF